MNTIFKGIWPFLAASVVGIALVILFPEMATFIPSQVR